MAVSRVTVVEVGPRDGLQNEARAVPAAAKLELVDRLQAAGVRAIEVTSFVSARRVPQLADGAAVLAGLRRAPGVRYAVLVPNLRGWEAAAPCRPDEVLILGSASDAFSRANVGCGAEEALERAAPVVAAARAAGVAVRGAISCAVGCPYQGAVAPAQVGAVAAAMRAIGVQTVGVADTIGVGTPRQVRAALEAALVHFPLEALSGHFHDTYGTALANVCAALELGVATFDASVSGLGGCPFARGATGNLATEDLVYLLHGMGIETGVDLEKLVDAGQFIRGVLGQACGSRAARALLARRGG